MFVFIVKQNAKSDVLKRAVAPQVLAAANAKSTAVNAMRPTETLSGEAEKADKVALNTLENEVSFLRSREVYLIAKVDELRNLVATLTHEIRAEDGNAGKFTG